MSNATYLSYTLALLSEGMPSPVGGVRLWPFRRIRVFRDSLLAITYDYDRHEAWQQARQQWMAFIKAQLPKVPALDPGFTLSLISKSFAAVKRTPLFQDGAELSEPRHRHR